MEPEARFTIIGAVLLALLLAAAAATVWLTRSGPRSEYRYYTVYFDRQSLHGLQLGGDVEMRGVQVGRVERFAITRDNIQRVQVTIRVDGRTPVSTNTVAVVSRKILTSVARIELVTTGDPGPELVTVPPGERYPVIAEGQSDFEQITDSLSRLAATGTSVLKSVDELLNAENREVMTQTLASIRDMAEAIKKTAEAAEKAGASTDRAAVQATATLRELARASTALERAADVGVNELRATAQEVRSSAEIVARTADRLDNPRALIFGPNPAQLGPGEKLR
jgi:phospholipid/cholesterol/gamma-HCH transport system substrate-binding protein